MQTANGDKLPKFSSEERNSSDITQLNEQPETSLDDKKSAKKQENSSEEQASPSPAKTGSAGPEEKDITD